MITYKRGNLLDSNCDIIVHQVNCQGVMGSGIAKQIRDKWPEVFTRYQEYMNYFWNMGIATSSEHYLGQMQLIKVEDGKWVANFFSQDKYLPRGICHTDYEAFRICCKKLKSNIDDYAILKKVTIGFPYKIGCGLAGGDWSIISKIIEEELSEYNVEI
jgi:O-acetyl-ADP-ribose deacetylase (regulator of RNase III)